MRKTKRALVLAGLLALLVTPLAGCDGLDSNTAEQTQVEEVKEPLNLDGTWKTTPTDTGSYMEAVIGGDTITVYMVSNSGTQMLYWAGSYTQPDTTEDSYSWTSQNDTTQTKKALLASNNATKEFTYSNGILSWEATAMGTTKTMEATRE